MPKTREFLYQVLPQFDEYRFKQVVRVSRGTFEFILDSIALDPVFNGENAHKQLPLWVQLVITLYRLGSYGDGNTIAKCGCLFGIGDGGTVERVTDRVVSALIRLESKYLTWPTVQERQSITQETNQELPNCLGYVDGTEFRLAERPSEDHEAYFSRKHQYSIKAQITCDHKKKIRHVVIGYPGSVHDARIYANSQLCIHPENFFSPGQYIIGDSAYKVSETVITPYKTNSRLLTVQERNRFNEIVSKYRIRVEHTIGLCKERFPSLKELRLNIGGAESVKKVCDWILATFILHNMILENGLESSDFEFEPESPENFALISNDDEIILNGSNAGEQKRIELLRQLLTMHR